MAHKKGVGSSKNVWILVLIAHFEGREIAL